MTKRYCAEICGKLQVHAETALKQIKILAQEVGAASSSESTPSVGSNFVRAKLCTYFNVSL